MARGVFVLSVLGGFAPACRHGYEVMLLDDADSSSDGLTGAGGTLADGGSAGDPGASTSDGASIDSGGAGSAVSGATGTGGSQGTDGVASSDGTTTGGGASAAAGGAGGTGGVDSGATSGGATTSSGGGATTVGGAAGMGGVGSGGTTTTTGGASTTSGAGSTGGSGGASTTATTTVGGASTTTGGVGGAGSTSTAATGTATTGSGGGTAADLASGYWLLDASDTSGKDWRPSTLVVTSTTPNADGTTDLTYRLDWFETAAGFGVLLGGEEIGVGNYDPATSSLMLTQTGGFASDTLDVYEAEYDAATDTLSGFWDTGTPGTFTAARKLDGTLLPAPSAVASSSQNGTSASNTVDADMFSEWSSSNGGTVGETLTLTLVAPARLQGLRIMALPEGNAGIPARLRVSSRDSGGNEVDLSDVVVPGDPMWNPIPLDVAAAVAEVRIEITEVVPAGSNRVMISGVELFGTP